MEKIKSFFESEKGKDLLIVLIVILVGLGCFELGRLSRESSPAIKIDYPSQDSSQTANAVSIANNAPKSVSETSPASGKSFFASSKGSKYYTLGCSGGKTIKAENRIYFATGEEAQAAGYTLSSSCN